VIGNWAATLEVRGPGSGESTVHINDIAVDANTTLRFQTSNFAAPQSVRDGVIGNIAYTLEVYAGSIGNLGTRIAGPITGTDAGFNGKQLLLPEASQPSNGRMVIRLTRQITLTQFARGDTSYSAQGTISMIVITE